VLQLPTAWTYCKKKTAQIKLMKQTDKYIHPVDPYLLDRLMPYALIVVVDPSEGLPEEVHNNEKTRITNRNAHNSNKGSNIPRVEGILYYTESTMPDGIYNDTPDPYLLTKFALEL
jgi:hypothetical protein